MTNIHTNLFDHSEVSVTLDPLVTKLHNQLNDKDYVQAFATVVEMRNATSELKNWLIIEISKEKS